MQASFKLDAKTVKNSSKKLEIVLDEFKNKSPKDKEELNKSDELDSTVKLIEKLSILNEYKLNLLRDFSSYKTQKK